MIENLSKRENEIFFLIINGKRTNEIAKKLCLKANTISTFKKSIYFKTKTNNLLELYKLANRYNLI